jgi:hypothetical protein
MLVIGNGESRLRLNIDKINKPKIGCNAIYRDFVVEHLVCVDKKMLEEVCKNCLQSTIYTREEWIYKYKNLSNIKTVPNIPYVGNNRMDEGWHWGSGPYAVLLGSQLASSTVHILGFDLYSVDGKINNIYKDSSNYGKSDKRAVDPSYWIYQIGKIFETFHNKTFIIHNTKDWILPKNWVKSNVYVDTDTISSYYK